jgi:S1-C subfamily serine protease
LLNGRGQVIGVNTAIIRGAQALCFAVASDIAKWVIPQLLRHGRVRRGLLGVGGSTQTLDRRVVRAYGLTQSTGVRIETIEPESAASRANLKAGDLILGLDGIDIASVDLLHQTLDESRIGKDCILKLLRGDRSPQPMYVTVRPVDKSE